MRLPGLIALSFVLSLVLFQSSSALDCFTDLDCTTGNRCVKQGDDAKGSCLESIRPARPSSGAESERPLKNTKGKICWSGKDCDPGQECIMKPEQLYGTCQ